MNIPTTISGAIITLNEELNIENCILALRQVTDEIVVLDAFSSDNTVAIAKRLGAKVIQRQWENYSASKNFLNNQCSCEYVFSIDADEVLSPDLIEEIQREKMIGLDGVYSMNRLTNYCGTWIKHSGWFPDVKFRLFPKNTCFWEGELVHETLFIPREMEKKHFSNVCFHFSYKDKIDHQNRADKYSRLTAIKMNRNGKKASFVKPYLSAIARFFGMYFLKSGYLDGSAGFSIARISAKSNVLKYKELRRLNKNGI